MPISRKHQVQTLLLATLIATASGCKIFIEVPEGGSVTTETGTYSCAASETCEIDVDEDNFDETFIAVPDEGYEFRGWKQQSPGLCQRELERLEPCSFSTVGYGLIPDLLALLLEDIPVFLGPEFAPLATTEIVFPTENSSAIDEALSVRGTASDVDGIAAITVNGEQASTSPAENAQTTDSGLYTSVDWQLSVDLQTGTNELIVGVEDGLGELNPQADSATVQNLKVVTEFSLDTLNQRLVGVVLGSGFQRELTSFDLQSGTQNLLYRGLNSGGPFCYQADTGEFFYLTRRNTVFALTSRNTETLEETTWGALTIDPEAEGFRAGTSIWDLECGAGHDNVYMVVNFSDRILNTLTTSRVVKFELATGEISVLEEFDTREGDASPLRGAKLMGDQLIVYYINRGPLFSLDTETGERTQLLVRESLQPLEIATDVDNNQLYLVNFDAIYRVNLDTGSDRILSVVPDGSPFRFPQPSEAVLDARNNRLLVGDSQLETVVQVSLSSGQRSEFLASRQGEGVSIVTGRQLYVASDRGKAYVLDDGGNVAEKLLEVDLVNGDRRQIGNLSQRFNGLFAQGLDVDEEAGVAYAAFSEAVYRVDLETEQVVQLAGNGVGFGAPVAGISDMVLDKAGNRLLIANSRESAVIELNLVTRVRTIFSQFGTRGEGDPFAGINALAFDVENNHLYAANQQSENIMSIDMETGDRSVILDACLDNSGLDQLGNFQTLQNLIYRDGELLIRDRGLRRFDIDSGECIVLGGLPFQSGVLDMRWLNGEVLMTSGFGNVGIFDMVTTEFVRISE